ncbi:asparagine synthase (glutamine-hydrolyzing) [Paractinoplanes ferrugineus]|uniref:asparagine synthase (glutamine-hydrolyzing) n=1 Tax=Paractinoplanes ferrugineus TaxID=113564 RepID=A0A919MGC6_9ACTN|nr:asparagine synthase (glutamine-hydrolyzing) [Actinoplanes ferrugineus]GIE13714.1 asparagine synthetase B [Actinoplanes ferrugineus]
MCGIAGWVDFDRDLRTEGVVLADMTATMALRGPDAGGVWLSPHAGLGHRRLAVIDIEGGRQPMIAEEDGRPLAVISYSGEVYNFPELRRELESYGHRFRSRSDTEVVLRAYLQWGEYFAERLNGMFAFALWDVRREELLLVRDRVGIKPLYYYPTPGGLLFGSEPKAILAHPLVDRVVDADGLRELFAGVKTPGGGVLRGMPELTPGHVLRIGRSGTRIRRYWSLTAHEHTDDLPTTLDTVRGLLTDIVERQVVADVPLCTMLSGGLDSSTLTALASRSMAGTGERVRSFSVDFVGYADNFEPDLTHPTVDSPYVQEVVDHVGAQHSHVVLGNEEMTLPEIRKAVVEAMDWPVLIAGPGSMDISLYLLFRAIRQHSTVALTGESADELFGGYPWFHHPEYGQPGTLPWSLAHNLGFPALFGPLRSRLDVAGYQRDQYRAAAAEVPRMPGESPRDQVARDTTYFFLTRFMRTLLDRKDRLSMALGLEVRVPFCDHRLQEYVFNTPWSMRTYDGQWKSLLRGAVGDLLPADVLNRPKTGYPVSNDPSYDRVVRDELVKLLATGDAAVEPLLNPAVVGDLRSDPAAAGRLTRIEVDTALHLNEWLTTYGLRLAL